MVSVRKDSKSECYVISRTDSEGFHSNLFVTEEELWDLTVQARQILE